jgi:hypothetical protein
MWFYLLHRTSYGKRYVVLTGDCGGMYWTVLLWTLTFGGPLSMWRYGLYRADYAESSWRALVNVAVGAVSSRYGRWHLVDTVECDGIGCFGRLFRRKFFGHWWMCGYGLNVRLWILTVACHWWIWCHGLDRSGKINVRFKFTYYQNKNSISNVHFRCTLQLYRICSLNVQLYLSDLLQHLSDLQHFLLYYREICDWLYSDK